MAMVDILLVDGDSQDGILELPAGAAPSAPVDMLSDTGIEELVLEGGSAVTTGYAGG
jgi:hypothetical protein